MGLGTQLDGCGQCMKYTLWIINFICLIGGLAVLGVGIWIVVDKSYMEELLGNGLYISAAYIMVATGIIIALLALIGCVGAIKEIKCLLLTYALLLFLIFVVLLVGGILGYVFREKVNDSISREMSNTMKEYSKKKAVTQAWDDTQTALKCCGVDGFDDWTSAALSIPQSCCRPGLLDCAIAPTFLNTYTTGCLGKIKTEVQSNANIIGGVAISIAVLLVFGIIFSCTLFKAIQ